MYLTIGLSVCANVSCLFFCFFLTSCSMVDEYEQEWKKKEREREELRKESLNAKHELDTRRRIEARVKVQRERDERGK